MHMVSRKDLNEADLETVRISRNPTTVVTANCEVLTKEEPTENVRELDLFVTVMFLEYTPAALSLGTLCEELGYSYHLTSGQQPHLIKNGTRIICNTANYVPFVVRGLSTSSSLSSSPTSPTSSSQDTVVTTEMSATARSESMSESLRRNPSTSCKGCQIGYRSSSMGWLMKVFQNIGTLPVLLVNYLWSREQRWYQVGTAFLLASRRTEIATSV